MVSFKKGLEGVVATQTSIASIDGKKGVLKYRGYNIKELAKYSNFEEVTYLLWYGRLPKKSELKSFQKKVRQERKVNKAYETVMRSCTGNISGMDALRTVTSYVAHCDKDLNNISREANLRKAIKLNAKFPTIVAHYWRIKNRQKIIQPKSNLSPGENFLYMLKGKMPTKTEARAMELDFLLTAEHGLNASTFTGRVSCSTLSDLHSAVVAAISTLKGPLHGGAREEIYKVLDKVKSPKKVEKFVLDRLKKKQVIMGFGHRVYKNYDPRALIFKDMGKKLAEESGDFKWYEISEKMEEVVIRELVEKKGKPIYPNVDFYTGAVYKYLGIPQNLTTSIFPLGRISGWVAHFLEQYEDNRLIRPRAKYVGPKTQRYPI